jgi:outer membrane protein insertion porin family
VTTGQGDVYNADNVEKSLQVLTTEVSRRGYAFAQVRPQGVRNPGDRTIDLAYVVEEGPRVYIERIQIRGNTRTLDHVIRREFDLEEGDAYNKVLIDRAERRLNALGFFKRVRVTNEPGSAPDKVIINVDVEDQPTGQFSIAGGYSTSEGFIAELGVSESNFLGRGQYVKISGSNGQYSRGIEFSFTEPYFLGYRLSAGIDLFSKYSDTSRTAAYVSQATGAGIRLGIPITDDFSVGLRYSLFNQRITVPNTVTQPFNDCSVPIAALAPYGPTTCLDNGEASIAIKSIAGQSRLTSLVGLSLIYNTLDNPRDPRQGLYSESRYEVAGLGGDVKFFRSSMDVRAYHELYEGVVGIARLQGGRIQGLGGAGNPLRVTDHYFLGPELVRGFAPSGIGPRDVSSVTNVNTGALGATTFIGASAELQFPILGAPRELGLRGAVFADAGTAFGFKAGVRQPDGRRGFDLNGNGFIECGLAPQSECVTVSDSRKIRSSVGIGLLWASPIGPIRFDYAWVLSKGPNDRMQAFRFKGGTSF